MGWQPTPPRAGPRPTPHASGISLATPSSEPRPDPTAYACTAVHGLIPSESRALHSALSPRRWTLGASVTGGLWGALGERLRDGLMGPVGMATPGLQNSTLDPAGVGVGGSPSGESLLWEN